VGGENLGGFSAEEISAEEKLFIKIIILEVYSTH
jgi:hypothetical protein